jgi:hypothetical protein
LPLEWISLLSHQFPSTVELSPQQHGPHQPVGCTVGRPSQT